MPSSGTHTYMMMSSLYVMVKTYIYIMMSSFYVTAYLIPSIRRVELDDVIKLYDLVRYMTSVDHVMFFYDVINLL